MERRPPRRAQVHIADVCFGSKTAAVPSKWDVRFIPENCRDCRRLARPLRADTVAKVPKT